MSMALSVADTLDRVCRHLPKTLDDEALARCARIAARVPDEASAHYLELRLHGEPRVDFLTFSEDRSIAQRLERQLGTARSARWSEHLGVLHEWANGQSELAGAPFVFFEYDAGEDFIAEEPEPSLSFGLEPAYRARHWVGLSSNSERSSALGKAFFRRLSPPAQREALMAAIDRCYAALPPLGAIPHAPVMTTRQPVTAKPYVILPRSAVLPFLEEIEWPGSFARLERLLDTYYAPFQESAYLDLTITDRVCERIGLVTSQFQHREADLSSLEWWRLPQSLAAEKAKLQGWPGHTEEWLGGERVWLQRWLDTKAVLNGTEIEYKAYLGFSATRPPLFC
jgi:hypothetical protein